MKHYPDLDFTKMMDMSEDDLVEQMLDGEDEYKEPKEKKIVVKVNNNISAPNDSAIALKMAMKKLTDKDADELLPKLREGLTRPEKANSLESVIEFLDELSPGKRKMIHEYLMNK